MRESQQLIHARFCHLQGHIKKDKDGYKDEFMLQWRHYKACLDIFNLKPSNESKQFSDLVMFIAHVSAMNMRCASADPSAQLASACPQQPPTLSQTCHPDLLSITKPSTPC